MQTAPRENHGAQDPARTAFGSCSGAAVTSLRGPFQKRPAASEETRLVSWEGAWHAEKEGRGVAGLLGGGEGEAGLER